MLSLRPWAFPASGASCWAGSFSEELLLPFLYLPLSAT